MSTAGPRVRVLVYATAPETAPGAVDEAYHRISSELAGTPGLLGNELLRSPGEPAAYVVMSEWEDLAAFQTWERGQHHRSTTAPLRPFQDHGRGSPFALYQVVANY